MGALFTWFFSKKQLLDLYDISTVFPFYIPLKSVFTFMNSLLLLSFGLLCLPFFFFSL